MRRRLDGRTVHDPDSTTRVAPAHAGPPRTPAGGLQATPEALTILTTEHWSLLAARSLGYTEAMARASVFVAALTGSVVALALVGQATDFGSEFVAFALVLLPVVFFLGAVTIVRLGQINWEDAVWTQGLNRLRHAYLEIAPQLEPYFVTSRYDDDEGMLRSAMARANLRPHLQGFVAIPGVIAVLDAVVAGAAAGIAALGLDASTGTAIAIGAAVFVLALAAFVAYAVTAINAYRAGMVVRFPTPKAESSPAG
jgi:hypothetical protein